MRFWILAFSLYAMVLFHYAFASECSDAKATRQVNYIITNQDSIDSAYYHEKIKARK